MTPRLAPSKPLDVLDMMAEAGRALDKARNAMPDERIAHLADLVEWAELALAKARESM